MQGVFWNRRLRPRKAINMPSGVCLAERSGMGAASQALHGKGSAVAAMRWARGAVLCLWMASLALANPGEAFKRRKKTGAQRSNLVSSFPASDQRSLNKLGLASITDTGTGYLFRFHKLGKKGKGEAFVPHSALGQPSAGGPTEIRIDLLIQLLGASTNVFRSRNVPLDEALGTFREDFIAMVKAFQRRPEGPRRGRRGRVTAGRGLDADR